MLHRCSNDRIIYWDTETDGEFDYEEWELEEEERERLAREENPIVGTTEMDIIALRNSGGLANLFRVKNQ